MGNCGEVKNSSASTTSRAGAAPLFSTSPRLSPIERSRGIARPGERRWRSERLTRESSLGVNSPRVFSTYPRLSPAGRSRGIAIPGERMWRSAGLTRESSSGVNSPRMFSTSPRLSPTGRSRGIAIPGERMWRSASLTRESSSGGTPSCVLNFSRFVPNWTIPRDREPWGINVDNSRACPWAKAA